MKDRQKKYVLLFIFIVLLLPIVQQSYPLFTSKKLDGYFTDAHDIEFTLQKWWDETYQPAKSAYLNDHCGFRPELLRLNGQIDYTFFGKIHSGTIVEGSSNYLYQDVLINAYYGRDYIGYPAIQTKLLKLKKLQDTLERLGKSLTLIYAPCKAYFYPDNFPDKLKSPQRTTANFETYKHIGDSVGINQIDFNSWFVAMKDTCKELLFTKQGFHWSVYGSLLAADSLTKYLAMQTHLQLPRISFTNITHTNKARATDNDIAKCMDIIFPVAKETFTYPTVNYKTNAGTTKTKTIYIGDSYLLTWIYDNYMDNINTNWELWYYFKIVWDKTIEDEDLQHHFIADYDWIKAMKATDNIVIMYTSRNLKELGNGFIESAYDYYYPKK